MGTCVSNGYKGRRRQTIPGVENAFTAPARKIPDIEELRANLHAFERKSKGHAFCEGVLNFKKPSPEQIVTLLRQIEVAAWPSGSIGAHRTMAPS